MGKSQCNSLMRTKPIFLSKQLSAKIKCIKLVLLCVLVLGACSSVGHRKVPVDRFNYNAAIVQSRNEQMLLNLVRLRYIEIPDFLAISSVITSYTYEGNVGASTTQAQGGPLSDTVTGSANLSYSERPTITYLPLKGQEFSLRLFKSLPVEAIFALGHAGWPVDILMAIALQRINDVESMSFGQVPSPGALDREKQFRVEEEKLRQFQRVLDLFVNLLGNEVIEMQQAKGEQSTLQILQFKENYPAEFQTLVNELKRELQLDPDINIFRVTNRVTVRGKDEITIKARSLMAIMSYLSRGIEVPQSDRDAGLVVVLPADVREKILTQIPLRIHTQNTRPDDPFVAVRYRSRWFYINHSDLESKRTFATIQVLFQLAAPSGGTAAPVLTLPAGG